MMKLASLHDFYNRAGTFSVYFRVPGRMGYEHIAKFYEFRRDLMKNALMEDLKWRGLLYQQTDEEGLEDLIK